MISQIHEKVEVLMPELLKSIQDLVSIYSVEGEATDNAPYGEGPIEALDKALDIASKLGFKTVNIDNKIGYAQYGEGNEDYLGIFGHVDVVPLGEGWTYDPLGGEIANNRIYGRGVLDNKGPILANLYALYALKELGIRFPMPIRIVFGTNEETGFKCVQHYLTQEKPPVFGWTPDCKWPVVYGERGRGLIRIVNHTNKEVFYNFINDYILSSPSNGVKLGINVRDEDFGEMIMRGYKLGVDEDGRDYFQMSLSYPGAKTIKELGDIIECHLPSGLEYKLVHNWNPVINNKDSKYIEPLTQSYEEIMGSRLEPVTTTGGTYAKIIPNIIAYGPSFPGQNGIAHLPDEWLDLDDLLNSTKIYATALYHLRDIL
ncbi:M20 family metallopeptidase [Erysipelothrix sp. HDW6A]|uniref:Sapep family Mn(2+)-dependent dipeptidase n=1 Tax=Erysipelothrix sp. HDW6A TaxID=2714928 RepID=UPI00140E5681|nr:Sapep family Mn(2+)-dependent dipeptidase [Erysipelothrix sp. HDW6A]QIK56737.1 M20 family metallopeptidase [Erysipelothrix sp. HDW6A]